MLIEGRKDNFSRLSPVEAKLVRKPEKFASTAPLDQKLAIAQKLGKRVYIIVTNDGIEINSHEFAKIFRYTFFSEARNTEAFDLIDEKGVVVFGSESVSRWMQRTELFLNSDLFEITKAIKKIRGKKVVVNFGFDNSEYELKDMFMHTVVRMFFAAMKSKVFLKFFSVTEKEFSIISVLWLSARPMTNEGLRKKMESLGGGRVADLRASLKNLTIKKMIHSVPKEATHVKQRVALWMLTEAGHDCMNKFIKRVTEETIVNLYE